jgi:hypothetical protein
LPTDYSSPGTAVLARLSDRRVAQYWDKSHLFAEQLSRRIETDASQPKPNCCTRKGIQWDEVAIYNQDAHWDGLLPRAEFIKGPVIRSLEFHNVIMGLLSH